MHRWLATILLLLTLSRSAYSQNTVSEKISYDGQTVGKIDLVSNPVVSVEEFESLVQQHVGEPYSNAKVSSTVAAMRATGRFNSVQIGVQPSAVGLELTFVLEPALYFGVFDFPGALKAFSFTKLLQVIDIASQTPYQPDIVYKSSENLRHFLIDSGFFQAQVQPDTQIDAAHMLANVVFHVTLGERAKLGNTEIRGAESAEAERLRQLTRSLRATVTGASLKPGKPYSEKRIGESAALMKRDLANRHHLAAKVGLNHPS